MYNPTAFLTPPDTPDARQVLEPVSTKIERLSTAVMNAINERDFDFTSPEAQEVVAHLAPNWKAQMDTLPPHPSKPTVTWDEQVAAWRQRAEEFPDVKFEVVSISSDVDEGKGKASVFMEMVVQGLGEGVTLSAMNEMRWRRINGFWLCYWTIGMRGSVANDGLG